MIRNKKGFTMVELLIVVAIIAILVSIIIQKNGGISAGHGQHVGIIFDLGRKGIRWETWEGQLKDAVTQGTWYFSVADERLLKDLRLAMNSRRIVRLSYRENAIIVPWEGATTKFVTEVTFLE